MIASEDEDYIIGPEDVLMITVWDNDDLTGKVAVTIEGYITYQLIGRIKVTDLTERDLADKISALLSDGYIVNPQVSVKVEEYKSQKQ